MPCPMTRRCVGVGGNEFNFHSFTPYRRVVGGGRRLSRSYSKSPGWMRLCDKAMHVVMRRRDPIRVLLRKGAKAGETEGGTSCRKNTTYESGSFGFLSFVSNREKGD